MSNRASIPADTQTKVLTSCKRRCCICVGLFSDFGVKRGQIAHIDQNSSNNRFSNLAFLCLDHHDQYDSKTSQSKGFTEAELRSYLDELHSRLDSELKSIKDSDDNSIASNVPTEKVDTGISEQEKQLYAELWNSLFELRLAAHNHIDWLQDQIHDDPFGTFIDKLNAYKSVVLRNEPFLNVSIFIPARKILTIGREIVQKTKREFQIREKRQSDLAWAEDQKIAQQLIDIDEEQQASIKEIDDLFDEVKRSIHDRTMKMS